MFIILSLFLFLIGLAVGSFLNAFVWRIKNGKELTGRSMCPRCTVVLGWRDLIPLVSFFVLGRKCRSCRRPISWQYPFVELVTAALFVLVFARHQPLLAELSSAAQSAMLIRDWFVITTLVFLFVFDARFGLLPDIVTIPSTVIIGTLNAFVPLAVGSDALSWLTIVGATVFGSVFFLLQYIFTHGKGVGDGDIRFGALMGSVVGWPGVWFALTLSYILGALIAVVLLFQKKKHLKSAIPLGPLLSVGTLAVFLFYDMLPLLW